MQETPLTNHRKVASRIWAPSLQSCLRRSVASIQARPRSLDWSSSTCSGDSRYAQLWTLDAQRRSRHRSSYAFLTDIISLIERLHKDARVVSDVGSNHEVRRALILGLEEGIQRRRRVRWSLQPTQQQFQSAQIAELQRHSTPKLVTPLTSSKLTPNIPFGASQISPSPRQSQELLQIVLFPMLTLLG